MAKRRGAWYFADILWAVSLLAFAFALLLACFARGRRQVIAAGFVFASGCFLACLQFGGSDAVPTYRPVMQTALGKGDDVAIGPDRLFNRTMNSSLSVNGHSVLGNSSRGLRQTVVLNSVNVAIYLRAANAIGMMLFGLAGGVLGALAFRVVGAKATG